MVVVISSSTETSQRIVDVVTAMFWWYTVRRSCSGPSSVHDLFVGLEVSHGELLGLCGSRENTSWT